MIKLSGKLLFDRASIYFCHEHWYAISESTNRSSVVEYVFALRPPDLMDRSKHTYLWRTWHFILAIKDECRLACVNIESITDLRAYVTAQT